MRFFTNTIITLLFFLIGGLSIVHGQIPVNDLADIQSSVENPSSFQNVTVKVTSFSTDLNKATISWYVNKKLVNKGQALTSFTLQTGAPGTNVTVEAVIKTFEGLTLTKSIIFHPSDVNLVWETDGIVPPFYKGKPTFAYQGDLRVVAMPNFLDKKGNRIDPSTLIYTWKLNYKTLGEFSGYGKQRFNMKGSVLPKSFILSVVVSSATDDTLHGEAVMNMDASDPEILLYEDNPLYGTLYNKAIPQNLKLSKNEIKLVAVPYFFSDTSASSLEYVWSINNLARPDLNNTSSVTLRTKGDVDGSTYISLTVNNLKEILQTANTAFTIHFTKNDPQF